MLIYVIWLLSWTFASSLFEVYFFGLGMAVTDIYLANAFWFVAGIITVPFFRGFRARDSMLGGIAISMLAVALLYAFPATWMAYVFRFMIGFTHVFFWAPFNTLYYEFRKGNNATLGALYYAVGPLLSLFAPAIAGFIAAFLGYASLYLFSLALFALSIALTLMLVENRQYSFDFIKGLKSVSGLRSLIFMEGFSAAVIVSVTLPLMLLAFVTSPIEFGTVTSLLTVFALLATFFTAGLSDRMKKRGEFIIPSVICFAAAAVLASQVSDLAVFFIFFGLVNFFSRIFFPLPLALAVDNCKSLHETMIVREFMLNVGRLSGTLVGYALFLFTDLRTVLLLQALMLILYIPLYENRKKKLARH